MRIAREARRDRLSFVEEAVVRGALLIARWSSKKNAEVPVANRPFWIFIAASPPVVLC